MMEAVSSVLKQSAGDKCHAIIVDDGCAFAETKTLLRALDRSHRDRITVVRQENRGLSAARNTGIVLTLELYPDALGIYFLDADNRIEADTIEQIIKACGEHGASDWFYPDIHMFGLLFSAEQPKTYSVLSHLKENICEAGSFVRMRVFADGGVRFDEQMRLGYEDWDFWLQAAARGYRGKHLPELSLRYRRRGESMVSESNRESDAILSYMRRKHRTWLSGKRISQLEAIEQPRFLLVDPASGSAIRVAAPSVRRDLREIQCLSTFSQLCAQGEVEHGPAVIIFSSIRVWAALNRMLMADWLAWELDRLTFGQKLAGARLDVSDHPRRRTATNVAIQPNELHVLAMSSDLFRNCIRDRSGDWLRGLKLADPPVPITTFSVALPNLGRTLKFPRVVWPALDAIDRCRDLASDVLYTSEWTTFLTRPTDLRRPSYAWLRIKTAFPNSRSPGVDVGFVLPIAEFGGVERVAHQYARVLRECGYRPHLILIGSQSVTLPGEFETVYESIRLINDPVALHHGSSEDMIYLGTHVSAAPPDVIDRIVAICSDLDVIINAHSAAFHAAASKLRALGARTVCISHVVDQTPIGRAAGHTFLTLAYEHSYDAIIAVSGSMQRHLHSLGVPTGKIIRVENSVGVSVKPSVLARVRRVRARRYGSLRCLFMGRLDEQKGADRLQAVVARTGTIDVVWRIVGRAVLDAPSPSPNQVAGVAVEDPVFDSEDVAAFLEWADIVVMPSRWEGLPLLSLDALSFGCVVVASGVGALNEVIVNGENGFVLDEDQFEDKCSQLLRRLAADRSWVRALASAAASSVTHRTWRRSLETFLSWLREAGEAHHGLCSPGEELTKRGPCTQMVG